MIRKHLSSVKPGEICAFDVFDRQGRALARQGSEFTESRVRALRSAGIPFVYCRDASIKPYMPFPGGLLCGLLRAIANYTASNGSDSAALKDYGLNEVKELSSYSGEPASRIAHGHVFRYLAKKICDCAAAEPLAVEFSDYRDETSYLDYHAASVSCLCAAVAAKMGLKEAEISAAACAGMLYDMKMRAIRAVDSPGKLGAADAEEMRGHAALAAEEYRKIFGMPASCAVAAAQHHERLDAGGYPNALGGDSISLSARILAVCDVYDAMTSRRPHRPRIMPDEAWEYIRQNSGVLFDAAAAGAFCSIVPKFRSSDIVALSSGGKAIVCRNNLSDMERPVIKIIEKKGGSDIISGAEIDLSRENSLTIINTDAIAY